MSTTPATPPEGERDALAAILRPFVAGEYLLADTILAAGYVRPAPTQEDRAVAEAIALRHHANSKSTLADDIAAALAAQRATSEAQVKELEESLHYANGVADLAMKHRDDAEAALATAREDALRRAEEIARDIQVSPPYSPEGTKSEIAAAITAERGGKG